MNTNSLPPWAERARIGVTLIGRTRWLGTNLLAIRKTSHPGSRAHLAHTTILKGLESLSPGLRAASYPGEKGRPSSTLKELHQPPLATLVVRSRCAPGSPMQVG